MEVLLQEVLTGNGALQKGGDVSRWMCRLSVLSEKLDFSSTGLVELA